MLGSETLKVKRISEERDDLSAGCGRGFFVLEVEWARLEGVPGGRCTHAEESSAWPLRHSCRHALNYRSIPACNPCIQSTPVRPDRPADVNSRTMAAQALG
ncbi:unnamed protein product [Leptosia nina]|uniref:Uncharacterized protein n=1 Tax=Leptosia nina TaxID=320188 RepID=A0AAV1JU44_9NEOP